MVTASLIVGNFAALKQKNIVRMLAYSSIAQGGFIILPLVFLAGKISVDDNDSIRYYFQENSAIQSTFIYLAIYLFANLGAFACIIAIARRVKSEEISKYSGLGQREPFLAVTLSIFCFHSQVFHQQQVGLQNL
jgi:NADH-quinone oxidoreductase subunit N